MVEITIDSPEKFHSLVNGHDRRYLYRGVPKSEYKLIPSIGRRKGTLEDIKAVENDMMWIFKSHAIPYLERVPENEWEWISLAQHHGLATRLLDWSRSPLVGLYFACEKEPEFDGALYSYQMSSILNTEKEKPTKVTTVSPVLPVHVSKRISVQSGMFTVHPEPNKEFDDPSIVKAIIPKEMKDSLIEMVSKYGIHRHSLFPDLDGLCNYISWLRHQ